MSDREQLHKDETRIYIAIKEAIQNGAFPPGYRLVEREVAKQFGTSRTPVRSAINRLATEGYIEQLPHRGAIVKKLSVEDIIKLLEVREALEGAACRLAVKYITQEDKDKLQEIIKEMEEAVNQNDFLRYYGLSGELHKKILGCCNNQYLYDMAERVNLQTTRFQFRNILVPGRIKKSIEEHKEIVEKVLCGDELGAEESMKKHIRIVKEMLLNNKNMNCDSYFTI
ncbi:MAG: GntR family transcriptional regulator [Firmicutes bacterium]|nr:GntR family transcriptional regulator [Bacillota bacterium]